MSRGWVRPCAFAAASLVLFGLLLGLSRSDVPPGRYTVTFWHEVLGKQTREVAVTVGGESRVAVEFKAK